MKILQTKKTRQQNKENRNIINSNEYIDDLGIRVLFNDEQIVSGCVCWYDNVDKCGLFEPVGTQKEHRGKGLAFSVMAKTIVNLSKYGATKVYVRTGLDNVPAIKLYEKLGFKITNYDHGFELDIT